MKKIAFYRTGDPYGNFSNFAASKIFLENHEWPTVEHYFQASKFADKAIQKRIREIDSPMVVAREGRRRDYPLREDWETARDSVMLCALRAKFTQNLNLLEELTATGKAELVEHTANDSYWADGGDGSGKNKLGILLMQVREEINGIFLNENARFPPWLAFPKVSKVDMFWRMGAGEEYLDTWYQYYSSLASPSEYESTFPEPLSWAGFYGG